MKFLFSLLIFAVTTVYCVQDIGWMWHVTDFHYDFSYWSTQLSCNAMIESRGIYGDYWCDSPWLLIEDSIKSMKKLRSDVDFILWTGDTIGHIKNEDLTIALNIDTLRNITNQLKAHFLDVPTYATLGNHDYLPSDQFPPQPNYLYNQTGEMWENWINDTEQVAKFKEGGYYSVKNKYGLRIICLNTNLYYTSDKLTADLTDPSGQFEWLDQQLSAAKAKNEKVIITAHVPPGIHTPSDVLWFYQHYNEKFLDLINSHVDDGTIKGMYYGHDHADGFKIFYKKDGTPAFPVFSAPSVTPWRYKIPTKVGPRHNPGIRLISYDRQTGQPINILMYYIDLPESNANNKTDWVLEYNFTAVYGVDDVTAPSLHKLINRMQNDRSLVDLYYKYKDVSVSNPLICNDDCRSSILCGFSKYRKSEFSACKDLYVGNSDTLKPVTTVIIAFSILVTQLI